MTVKTRPFDPAEFINDDADVAAFIDASLEQDDASELARSLGVIARARGMSQIARETGLSREALYRALSETGNPELDTLLRVMKALRLKLSVSPANAAE